MEIQQYGACSAGLIMYDRVVMDNEQVVILPSLRTRVLEKLHSANQGMVGMLLGSSKESSGHG